MQNIDDSAKPGVLEVERRYIVDSRYARRLKEKLLALGFAGDREVRQVDEYYTSEHEDFIATEECLRIRREGRRATLTWKPPTSAAMQESDEFWKEEVDLDVTGQEDVVKRLLRALDFIPYVVVDKHRSILVGPKGVEIGIDRVQGLRSMFVELEVKTADVEEGLEAIEATVRQVGLTKAPINKVPYRDLVWQSKTD